MRGTRWKVEWIEPTPGLIDYIASKNIIVPWKQRAAFTRDEHRAEVLAVLTKNTFPGRDTPIADAVEAVLLATGEQQLSAWNGVLEYDRGALNRVATRAGTEPPQHPAGYTDRHGTNYLPFECALTLAKAFAAVEPRTVLDHIDAEEQDIAFTAREPGNRYLMERLNESRASWALVRQWAGLDQAVALREARIGELERLLTEVMWNLRKPNPDPERISNRIERALRRH